MNHDYDIIIIGGGPAGLSAATGIVRQDHKTVLFDSGKYRNALSKHMHTVPTWDHRDPSDFRAAAKEDFKRYGSITIENIELESLKRRDDGLFEATANQKTWTGKKVVLATGVEDVFPAIPGYADCWVTGIFHCCLYCHGWEEKGASSAGVLAEGDLGTVVSALTIARQALRMSEQVTLYTNGNEQLAKELTNELKINPAPIKVDARTITELVKAPQRARITLHFEDNDSMTEGFLAHKPKTKLRGSLAQQLGHDLTPMNFIRTAPPFNQTSINGVFAAGDCCTPMHTVTSAIYTGGCTGGGAPLQMQAELYNQKSIF
ncbi:hypothetical protein BCR34DRAFT_624223 [Clohesyomyces aquaticus]|uniref:FAD/NAD(P)-binding domain-containing protein n=1 Tax=Clohesyomyces aquaticus TaxID=1231657 RepID=A0A1Y1ZQQ4_9PLEO|nr:hypothetical protein BCR34DRAFT_624223 [Clohesyomyces aquaticus]